MVTLTETAAREVNQIITQQQEAAKKLGFKEALAPRGAKKNSFISGVKDLRQALIDYVK